MSPSPDRCGAAAYVRAYLRAPFRADEARRRRARQIVRAGGRVVTGGMTCGAQWELRDWLTDELVGRGSDGPGGLRVALLGLCHADSLYAESDITTSDVPLSLRRALEEWVCEPDTPDEDIAEFVGWAVDLVRECR
ncbi:hypothetical protein Aab01nite_82980 [Paractinoplanes abujensis]|uniref:Uncharacterized protein n=1 Tax=Paractinoplanes abujensis TaxID=882441 RepID=A0A7W7FXF6_9ACTN|nr:hypothetical protein [Actinoplanes abujensis]MBB4689888.1 hypothetical protein [Actinoplanes abujensis]GID24708.1 hypothetical protein Aab01nite_82980 [Actinoplanes abujensis]